MFVHNIDPDEDSIYSLSSTINLVMNYNSPGNFTSIQLSASNDEGVATQQLDVEFKPLPPTDGVKWYIIVLIVCGSLIAVLLAAGILHRYCKKQNLKKDTLLESENQIESSSEV